MNHASSSQAHNAPASAYRVELPRVSDAVALSLRDAYSRNVGLPEDMADTLRRLNRISGF